MRLRARGGMIIGIAPAPPEAFEARIAVPDLDPATAIVNAAPAPLLGYSLALLPGEDWTPGYR